MFVPSCSLKMTIFNENLAVALPANAKLNFSKLQQHGYFLAQSWALWHVLQCKKKSKKIFAVLGVKTNPRPLLLYKWGAFV